MAASAPAAILGRLPCLACGFPAGHVKRREGKRPFFHCPDCGVMAHAKNGHQEQCMVKRMRPEPGALPEPPGADRPIIVRDGVKTVAPPLPPKPAPAPDAPPPKPASWVDQLLGGK